MASQQPQQVQEEPQEGVPAWMTTFSDCMTLLLTFFVLLLTFSSFDPVALRQLEGAIKFKSMSSIFDFRVKIDDTLIQLAPLNEHINSQSSATGSMFYQIHAMAEFQSGQSENAVKDLIIRHYYLLTPQDKQHNQQLIWHYLAGLSTNENSITSNTNKVDHIYTGWLELAHIIRTGNDSQILQQNINIWIQNYPEHQSL